MCDSSVHSKMWTKMWLKAVYATAFIAFEVALVKMSLAASIHDCWNPEKLNRMKFPVSQRETFFFAFFLLFILWYTCIMNQLPNYHLLLSSTFISCWNWHNKNQLSLVFRFSSFELELGFFYVQSMFFWLALWNDQDFQVELALVALPQTMLQIEAGTKYLLKFVTCPWCFSSKQISFEKCGRPYYSLFSCQMFNLGGP